MVMTAGKGSSSCFFFDCTQCHALYTLPLYHLLGSALALLPIGPWNLQLMLLWSHCILPFGVPVPCKCPKIHLMQTRFQWWQHITMLWLYHVHPSKETPIMFDELSWTVQECESFQRHTLRRRRCQGRNCLWLNRDNQRRRWRPWEGSDPTPDPLIPGSTRITLGRRGQPISCAVWETNKPGWGDQRTPQMTQNRPQSQRQDSPTLMRAHTENLRIQTRKLAKQR